MVDTTSNGHLVLAVSMKDAQAECKLLGLEFSRTVWVLGLEYMGEDFVTEGWTIHKTAKYILKNETPPPV